MANSSTRKRLEQFLANSSCEANVRSVLQGIPMARVAEHLGVTAQSGLSPFARRSGVTFEASLFDQQAARLRQSLVAAKLLPDGDHGLLDLRLRQQGGSCASLDDSRAQFEQFLQELAAGERADVALVAGPALALPSHQTLGDGLVAIDVLLVDRHTTPGRLLLRVGEIKSYADRGGHTDRSALAAARSQAGLYLHVLRQLLARLDLATQLAASDDGFLVLRSVKAHFPRVRAPEELTWQAEQAGLALARLAQIPRPPPVSDPDSKRHLDLIAQAPRSLDEGCLRFCELASHCHACAHEQGDPRVLGEDVARLLPPGLTLHRLDELLGGTALPANDAESLLLQQLRVC